MDLKDFWKKKFGVCIYDTSSESFVFYCNKFKLLTKKSFNDFLWDFNPDNMSLMDYLTACKVYTYLLTFKVDAFGTYPNGQHISIVEYTPNGKDYLNILF